MPSRYSTDFRRVSVAAFLLSGLMIKPTAHAGERAVLSYYLPKTTIAAAVHQRLVSCPPEHSKPIIVDTRWTLKSRTGPDYGRPVHVDAATGFLAKRSVAVTLNPDGTLAAFSSSAEGQGGPMIASVLKLAGTLAPMMVGGSLLAQPQRGSDPEPAEPRCTVAALELLADHETLSKEIANAEQLVRQGGADNAAEEQLARDREALLGIEQELTLTGEAPPALTAAIAELKPGAASLSGSAVIPRLDYSLWFVSSEYTMGIPGAEYGYGLDWAANKAAGAAVIGGSEAIAARGKQRPADQNWDTRLVYRRPVPALLYAYPPLVQAAALTLEELVPLPTTGAEQVDFTFTPTETRRYRLQTVGEADTKIAVAEMGPGGAARMLGVADDSAKDGNANLSGELEAGKSYRISAHTHYAPLPSARPAHRSSLKPCSAGLGPFPVGLRSTTSRHGASPMIGPIPFRSRWRKSKCSSGGSATFSTNCFPRPSNLNLRRLP